MDVNTLPVINRSHLASKDVVKIAQYLLGKIIVSQINDQICMGKIVETEAYRAPDDKASHAYLDKRTQRTETMFGEAGKSYVYLIYGLHQMLNVVTGPKGSAHAVLIRAIEPMVGMDQMMNRRKGISNYNMTNGPGKLCKALGISKSENDVDLCNMKSPLWIADQSLVKSSKILSGPRVGIGYAEECALWPWRFRIKKNPWSSLPHEVKY